MTEDLQEQSSRWDICQVLTDFGARVRRRRRRLRLTQAELAGLSGVGVRFIAELEAGKPGVEFGRALHVMQQLGLELRLQARDQAELPRADDA